MTARQTQGANKQPQRRAAVRHHVLLPAVAGQTFTLHRLPDLESAETIVRASKHLVCEVRRCL